MHDGKLCLICFFLLSTFWNNVTTLFAPTPVVGEVTPTSLKLVEGSTLVLNCTLFSDSEFNSSHLYFYVQPQCNCVVDRRFYQTNGSRSLILTYPNVTAGDSTYQYLCYANKTGGTNTKIGQSDVDVGYMPDAVTNITAISYNFENMSVTWSPCQKSVTYRLFWSLTKNPSMNGSASIFDVCLYMFCPTPDNVSCKPTNCPAEAGCFFPFGQYTINITASNSYATNNNTAWLMFTADGNIVKPNPVEKLQPTGVNSTSISVSWSSPTVSGVGIPLSLLFRVDYTTQWNSNVTVVDVGNSTYTVLNGLVPYTEHSISVLCKPNSVGGYWSDATSTQQTTLESAPAVPPKLPVGWFRTGSCSSQSTNCTVTMFWQAVPEPLRNGVITKFIVTVRETGATTEFIGGSDSYSAQISLNSQEVSAYWLGVSAATSIGPSPAGHSLVSLPAAGITALHDVYMESTADNLGVFISWKVVDVNYYSNFTVIYCDGVQDVNTRCDSDPVNIVLPNTQTNWTLLSVNAKWVYSLAGNTVHGSTGLPATWLCKYEYYAPPAAPKLVKSEQTQDKTLVVEWILLQCDSNNRARVVQYIVVCSNTAAGFSEKFNVSGTVNSLTIPGLGYGTSYQVTLWAESRQGTGPAAVEQYSTKAKPVDVGMIVGVTIGCTAVVAGVIALLILMHKRYKKWKDIAISVPNGDDTIKNGNNTSPLPATPYSSCYFVSNGSANGYSVISNGNLRPALPTVAAVNVYDDVSIQAATVEPRSEITGGSVALAIHEQLPTESAQSSVASGVVGDRIPVDDSHITLEFNGEPGDPHPTSGTGSLSLPANVDVPGPPAAVHWEPSDTSSSVVDSYHKVVEVPTNVLADTTQSDVSEHIAASLLLDDGCHVNEPPDHLAQAACEGVSLHQPVSLVKIETDDLTDDYNRVTIDSSADADNSGRAKSDVSDYNRVQCLSRDDSSQDMKGSDGSGNDGSSNDGSNDSDEDGKSAVSSAGYQKATTEEKPLAFVPLDCGPAAEPMADFGSASSYPWPTS